VSAYNLSADSPCSDLHRPLPMKTTQPDRTQPEAVEGLGIPAEDLTEDLEGTLLETDGDDDFPTVARENLNPDELANIDLLVKCIDAEAQRSGRPRSAQRFAKEVLIRDPRTVRRWLAGDNERGIPAVVVDRLHAYLSPPAETPAA
jgi:hypothetical protein